MCGRRCWRVRMMPLRVGVWGMCLSVSVWVGYLSFDYCSVFCFDVDRLCVDRFVCLVTVVFVVGR